VCLGKGLGGGVAPIGAVLGSEQVLGAFDDTSTGSTWAWLPMSCAAALAMLDELARPGVLDHVLAIEDRSRVAFGALAGRFDAIGDVRVAGALTAVEFVRDRDSRRRDTRLQDLVATEAFARGLLTDSSTTSLNIQPSLVTPLDVIDQAAGIVADALAAALSQVDGAARDPG
jgi:4-aminobutyrate aminotransferase-like enzyme